MKKILILFVALAVTFSANAQVVFGVKVGGNFSNLNVGVSGVSVNANTGYKVGGYIGGTAEIGIGGKFYLQPELIYSYGGTQISVSDKFINEIFNLPFIDEDDAPDFRIPTLSANVNTSTFRLPVLVKYKTSDGFSLLAGPYVSLGLISGVNVSKSVYNELIPGIFNGASSEAIKEATELIDLNVDGATTVLKENVVKLDFGATIGAEYEFNNGVFIEARYNYGLNSIVPSTIKTDDLNAFGKKVVEDRGATWDPEDNIPNIVLKDVIGDIKVLGLRSSIQLGVGFRF